MNNNKNSAVSDVDQTNDSLQQQPPSYYASSSSTQPSAPTQYDLIPTPSPPLQQNYYNYQTMPQPQQYHTIEIPPPRYIIRRKESDYKRFPIQASVFLLGCL